MKSILAYIASCTLGAFLAILNVQPKISEAFDLGYMAGAEAEKPSIKQLVLEEPKYVSKICKSWWFDMTTKDRKL